MNYSCFWQLWSPTASSWCCGFSSLPWQWRMSSGSGKMTIGTCGSTCAAEETSLRKMQYNFGEMLRGKISLRRLKMYSFISRRWIPYMQRRSIMRDMTIFLNSSITLRAREKTSIWPLKRTTCTFKVKWPEKESSIPKEWKKMPKLRKRFWVLTLKKVAKIFRSLKVLETWSRRFTTNLCTKRKRSMFLRKTRRLMRLKLLLLSLKILE